jgi:hypothetical protein
LNQGICINARVNAVDKRAADDIAGRLPKDSIDVELKRGGLPEAKLLETASVVITANGNQTAASEVEATLLLSGQLTVGMTVAVSIVFAGMAAWILKDFGDRHTTNKAIYLLDFLDTICDWASWAGTNVEGDFTFSNDRDGFVKWTLFVISISGTLLFLISTYLMFYENGLRQKKLLILQLGFENFAQGILYIIVASSQASTSNRVSVFVGIVQALCFCAFQIHELKSLQVDNGSDGNNGGGTGGNLGAEGATGRAAAAGATSGRCQPIETSTTPAPAFTSMLGFPSGSSNPAGFGDGQPQQFGSQDFGGGGFGQAPAGGGFGGGGFGKDPAQGGFGGGFGQPVP